jgi:hypothetical protein
MAEDRKEVEFRNGKIIEGDRAGSRVVVAPINGAGLHEVIFATGATAWYLPEDIELEKDHG